MENVLEWRPRSGSVEASNMKGRDLNTLGIFNLLFTSTSAQLIFSTVPRYQMRRVVPIRGDGNCMFRSVAYCVFGTQERHREIRMKVVERVVAEWHRYRDFIIGDRSYGYNLQSSSDYRNLMSRDGEYAGHVELHCVSEIFVNYTFKVHRNHGSRTIDYGRGPMERHLLFSGYCDAGHYSVIEY